jgi:type III secretion protein O
MSSAIVDDLLDIKIFREERASGEVTKCRLALEEAVMLVERRKQELADYRVWRVRRENEMWDGIEQQLVHLQDLEDLKADIGLLRGRETVFEQRIQDAENARGEARTALDAAEAAYTQAQRNRQKFEEVSAIFEHEERLERERLEELELEEFTTPRDPDAEADAA